MTLKRRWIIPFAAALLALAALPVHAQTQTSTPREAPEPAPAPAPRFCVGLILENGILEEFCEADFLACVNGYDKSGSDLTDCSFGLCMCYDRDLPQLPTPAQCYAAYERCLPPNPNDIPPATATPEP